METTFASVPSDGFSSRSRGFAAERGLSLNRLAATIDASRGVANLSSAIRVFVLEAQGRADEGSEGAGRSDQ